MVDQRKWRTKAALERQKLYSTRRWKQLRKQVLAAHPICAHCGKAPSTQADHIRHTPDNSRFWDWNNLRGSCAPCNNREGARDRHRRDRQPYAQAVGGQTGGGGYVEKDTAQGGRRRGPTSHDIFCNSALSLAEKLLNRQRDEDK